MHAVITIKIINGASDLLTFRCLKHHLFNSQPIPLPSLPPQAARLAYSKHKGLALALFIRLNQRRESSSGPPLHSWANESTACSTNIFQVMQTHKHYYISKLLLNYYFWVLTIFLKKKKKQLRKFFCGARMAPSGQSVSSQILFSHRFSICLSPWRQ
jgi:hypothetical protein